MELLVIAAIAGYLLWRGKKRRGEVAPVAEVGAVGWTDGTDWRALRPLAHAEARRLVRHPMFLVGVAITPFFLLLATFESSGTWWETSGEMSLGLVPLGWMTILAVNLLGLQPRRTGADELMAAAPLPQPARTIGLVVGSMAAAVAAVLLAAAWIAYELVTDDAIGSPHPDEIAVGVLIVAGGAAVGVSVARWLPGAAFGVVAVVAVIFIQARLFEDMTAWPWSASESHPGRFLGFLAPTTSVGVIELEVRPIGWHLAYLVGLIIVMVVVGLARDGMPRRLGAAGAVALLLVAGSGWAQTRPPSDARVASMVAYLADPRAHQECTVDGLTSICAYPEQLERVDDWAARAKAIRALVPANVAARELTIADRVRTVVGDSDCGPLPFTSALPTQIARAIGPDEIWPDDGAVHPGTDTLPCSSRSVHELFTSVQIGSWAVGLPSSPHGLDERCSAAGEARAVLALWLGAVVSPEGARSLRDISDEGQAGGVLTYQGWNDPPMLGAAFAVGDVALAIDMLSLPDDEVAAAIGAEWSSLTARGTPRAELAQVLDLDSPGGGVTAGFPACP